MLSHIKGRCVVCTREYRRVCKRIYIGPVSYTHLDVYKRQAPKPKPKSKATGESITAQDVLDKIPSLDLSKVHVKENITFDFKAGGASTAGDDSLVDVPTDFPEGQPNCLLGLTIVFTGVLPTLERGESEALAKRYGARVTKSISSKTSVVVLGDEAGPKKLEKIKQLKVKAIDEEGFKQLIAGMPAEGGDGAAAEKARLKKEQEEAQAMEDAQKIIAQEDAKKERIKLAKSSGAVVSKEDIIRDEDKLWTCLLYTSRCV